MMIEVSLADQTSTAIKKRIRAKKRNNESFETPVILKIGLLGFDEGSGVAQDRKSVV